MTEITDWFLALNKMHLRLHCVFGGFESSFFLINEWILSHSVYLNMYIELLAILDASRLWQICYETFMSMFLPSVCSQLVWYSQRPLFLCDLCVRVPSSVDVLLSISVCGDRSFLSSRSGVRSRLCVCLNNKINMWWRFIVSVCSSLIKVVWSSISYTHAICTGEDVILFFNLCWLFISFFSVDL